MEREYCKAVDFDNRAKPSEDKRCFIHTIYVGDIRKGMMYVDHYDKVPGPCTTTSTTTTAEALTPADEKPSPKSKWLLLLPSATKLRRLCFYRRLSVHRGGGVPGPGRVPGLGGLLLGGAWSWGGVCSLGSCLLQGGLLPGGWYPSMH